ncbi:MAG TPA: hypothetical protein VK152_00330 [Paludibacter sp.]|nr:hypothetical protein [Paludibacter sp.]
MEERINNWWNNRNKKHEPEFKGSLKLKPGLTKYSLNMKTNELKTVSYTEDYEAIRDNKGEIKYDKDGFPLMRVKSRKAKFDPMLVYIDAMNDETAIRKANNYLFGIKPGVKITQVTREEVNAMEFSMN